MTKDQIYNENVNSKEATGQQKDQNVIKNLVDEFARGEITLTEMWRRIDDLIDAHHFRKNLTEPLDFRKVFSEQSSEY